MHVVALRTLWLVQEGGALLEKAVQAVGPPEGDALVALETVLLDEVVVLLPGQAPAVLAGEGAGLAEDGVRAEELELAFH